MTSKHMSVRGAGPTVWRQVEDTKCKHHSVDVKQSSLIMQNKRSNSEWNLPLFSVCLIKQSAVLCHRTLDELAGLTSPSHWQDHQCIKINLCIRPTPTCLLDITLYKASTSSFCCLLACEQILALLLPLASTPPASFTPQPPPSSAPTSPVFLCTWSHMTQQNPRPGAGLSEAFSQEGRRRLTLWKGPGALPSTWLKLPCLSGLMDFG